MLSERTQPISWTPGLAARSECDRPARPAFSVRCYPQLKRLLDIVLAGALLVLLFPLMILIAAAIRLDSPGPVIYTQRRGGLNGRLFNFYKFRSMTNGHDHTEEHKRFAEAYINGHGAAGQTDGAGRLLFKPESHTHTVTRVGRWLRRVSLDELPQLVNVLTGDMSLVGPRPSMDYEVAMYTERHRQRLAVPPGLTGWAQINGRSSLTFDKIVELDLAYISERSLRRDISILLATLPVILQAESAG